MIQRKGKLCYSAMKLAQWPTLSFGVSKALWPGLLKGQITSVTTYSSSTIPQAQDLTKDESQQQGSSKRVQKSQQSVKPASSIKEVSPKENPQPLAGKASKESSQQIKEPLLKIIEPSQKELDAVMKVKSLSEALEVCSNFDPKQCLAALKNLAKTRSRPVQLIQSLTKRMSNSVKTFNVKEITDVLFSLSKLSYIDENLLLEASKSFRHNLQNLKNAAIVGSAITSLRKLQWKDPELLDELSVWMLKNFDMFQNPSSFIYTLALQNHSPKNLDELLPLVWNNITENVTNPVDIVNFMWSCFLLNSTVSQKILEENLSTIFNPAFLQRIKDEPRMILIWNQLSNLHAASKYILKEETTLAIPENVNDALSSTSVKNEKVIMTSLVKELLFKDMNTNLYSTFVPTNMGFSIDLVLTLDKKMRALPVDLNAPSCTRVAVMIHSYNECCRPSMEPNGYRIFEMKLLEDNFKVVSVPCKVLDGSHTEVHKYFAAALRNATRKNA